MKFHRSLPESLSRKRTIFELFVIRDLEQRARQDHLRRQKTHRKYNEDVHMLVFLAAILILIQVIGLWLEKLVF